MIRLIIVWVVMFPAIGVLLQKLGLEHPVYFACYGAMFALIAELLNGLTKG